MRARYTALSTPAVGGAQKRQRVPGGGAHVAAERVKKHHSEQRAARKAESSRLTLENGVLKDEVHHLRLKLSNAMKQSNILKSKFRGIDNQLLLSSTTSLSQHSVRRPKSQASTTRPQRRLNPANNPANSPQRPSTTGGTRKNKRGGSPFRPLVSTRLIATPDNEYKDFTRRIDRLKQRVSSLEQELHEEQTKSRLEKLRQLSNVSGSSVSKSGKTQHQDNRIKHGMAPSFWQDLKRDKHRIFRSEKKGVNEDDSVLTVASNNNRHRRRKGGGRGRSDQSFHADTLLQELTSSKLLQSSLHMTHDVRKEWTLQLKNNVDRLCGVSEGFKQILQSVSSVMQTSPFNGPRTATTIATELSSLFGAHMVRIFILSDIKDQKADEHLRCSASSSFTFVPIAHVGKKQSGKLVKSDKIIVDVNLTSAQVSEKMQHLMELQQQTSAVNGATNEMNDASSTGEDVGSEKNSGGKKEDDVERGGENLPQTSIEENVLLKNSRGMGFVAGTFLRGSTILATGDLWEHECFNRSTDSSWLSPGNHSLLSVPVRFQPKSMISSTKKNVDLTSSLPFGIIQLMRPVKNDSDEKHQAYDHDSILLLQGLVSILAPALHSCSRSMITSQHKNVVASPLEKMFETSRTTTSSTTRERSKSQIDDQRSISLLSQNEQVFKTKYQMKGGAKQSGSLLSSRDTNIGGAFAAQAQQVLTQHRLYNKAHHSRKILSEVTSRRIRWAAESAGVLGDVGHASAPGMVKFLHAVTAIIHSTLSADRTTLYLSRDMFGGVRMYHDDEIMFAPVSRALTPLDLSSRLAMVEEGIGTPDEDDAIIDSLQEEIEWDPLDGTGSGGLSIHSPFHVHEELDDHHQYVHQTTHHHHKPRSVLRKRTDLAAYVASQHEVVRMMGAYEDPVTKFAVDSFDINGEEYITDSILVVPIILNEETVGVIELFNKHALSGGNDMLTENGFEKHDETLLVHFASELSAALSSVERQGRAERMSETFCKLYYAVGLASAGGSTEMSDENMMGQTNFGKHLMEVEAVVRELLVAQHVFIWVADHTVGGLRTYFQKRNQDMLLDVHYSQRQLSGSALGAAYFQGKSLNYSNLADVRANNLKMQDDSTRMFKPEIDIPDLVSNAQSMICVPLVYSGTSSRSEPVGVLQIINLDTRELAVRCLRDAGSRLIQYTEQVAAQTATCIGCLLRMDSYARAQQQMHELLGTFALLHHSSSLRPVDLILSSVQAVSAIFQTSNRKVARAILVLRDREGNFIWARPKEDSAARKERKASGTGAFDDMFHQFDSQKKKVSHYDAMHGRRTSRSMNIKLDGEPEIRAEHYNVETFSPELDTFVAYVARERRPVVLLQGIEEVATAGNHSSRITRAPKTFTTEPDKQMELDSMGTTLGVSVPVSQQDGLHMHDIHCVLLLQRDQNSNLPFAHEDRDLAGLVVAHLGAAIASVVNTTDLLRRERALGDLLGMPSRIKDTMKEDHDVFLTLELDEQGYLIGHNYSVLFLEKVGFVSRTLSVENLIGVSRVSVNLIAGIAHLDYLTSSSFELWMCDSVKDSIQKVLDKIENGEPPSQTWSTQTVELPVGNANPKSKLPQTEKKNKPKSKLLSLSRTFSSRPTPSEEKKVLDPKKMFSLRLKLLREFMATFSNFGDDGQGRLLGLFAVSDNNKKGLLALAQFYEVLKFGIGTKIKITDIEDLSRSMDSLVHGDSYTDKRVHYVKFVRALIPPVVALRKARLTVIPKFSATSTSTNVNGVHLRFSLDSTLRRDEHFEEDTEM